MKKYRTLYLACEEMDFTWRVQDIEKFEQMWKQGADIRSIAEELERDPDEVAILAIDRARKGRIEQRQGGLLGVVGA